MEVSVLGPLEVRRDGVPVALGARLQRAVLAILVLEAGRVVPADRLADLLWHGSPPPKTSASLHTIVAHLRRALEPDRTPRSGPSVIETAAPGYRMAARAVDLDADRFERLLSRASGLAGDDDARALRLLDEALQLWRGPALAEFAGEPFARAFVERLETLRQSAVELRGSTLLALGDAPRAVAELQAHVAAHPLREQARGSLARALYLAGRQAEALAVLTEGRRLLREDLGLDPGPELRRLEQQILDHDDALRPARPVGASSPGLPSPAPAGPRLAGRDAELARLSRQVRAAAGGAGSVVVLTGDAGLGKTALVEAVCSAVRAAGGTVRAAACRDGLAAPPYWPVLQLVRQAAAALDGDGRERLSGRLGPLRGLVPDLGGSPPSGGVDPTSVRVHLSDALQLALEAAPGTPALLAVDDLHLADPASLQLLTDLAAGAARSSALLLFALRPGEGSDSPVLADALAALGRVPRLLRLDLTPLTDAAVAELAQDAAPTALDDATLAGIVERAEGNPFFALELARVAAQSVVDPAPPEHGRPVSGVPAPVFDLLRQRVLRLPEPGEALLSAMAVAGEPLSPDDVAAVTGTPAETALTVLEVAVRTRLAVDTGEGRFGLAHALLGEALQASLSSARTARLHRALGERLAARSGADPQAAPLIAHHLLAARSLDGGAAAIPWLERAADAALEVSALPALRDRTAQLLTLPALATAPDGGRRELRARSRIAYVDVWLAGYDSPSVREYCRLVDRWTVPPPAHPDDLELLWTAALFQCQVGRLDDAERTVARMGALAGGLDDATATYLAADMTAVVSWMQGRPTDALAALDRAERVAGAADLRRSLAFSPPTRIAVVRAHALWLLGQRDEARAQADRALRAGAAAGLGAAGFARRWVLVLALQDGDPEWVGSLVSMEVTEPAWERYRYPSAVVAFAQGWLATRAGALAEGLAAMREAHTALVEQGLAASRSVFLGSLAEAALAVGDARQALAYCTAGLAVAERGERFWVPHLERLRVAALAAAPSAGAGRGRQAGAQGPRGG